MHSPKNNANAKEIPMTRWNDIKDLKSRFGIADSDPNNLALKSAIKSRMLELHPDKNDGDFTSKDCQQEFMDCADALEFIESLDANSKALIAATNQSELMILIKELAESRTQESKALRYENIITSLKARSSKSFTLPKIGSGTFAAITAFLIAFPDNIKDNPLLGGLLSSSLGQIFLLYLLALSSFAFVMSWIIERSAEAKMEYLTSESFGRSLAKQIHRFLDNENQVSESKIRELIDSEIRFYGRSIFARYLGAGLRISDYEKIAQLQIERLKENNVIEVLDRKGFDVRYKFNVDSSKTGFREDSYDFSFR